jgi:riboflavin synthase
MFTGIVENTGTIKTMDSKKNLLVLGIDLGKLAKKVKVGDSVSINGVCLTTTSKKNRIAHFDLMKETIERTSLRSLGVGSHVNLELALRADSRLGGHFVTGHVDEVALIKNITREKNWVSMKIGVSGANRRYIVPKGSATIEGISLTVGRVGKNDFEVYLIPYTLKITNLKFKKPGDPVNIETDILAKYLLGGSKT